MLSFLIDQQSRQYKNALDSWANRARQFRSLPDLARHAAHPPLPGNMARAAHVGRPDKHRAEMAIEQIIMSSIAKADRHALVQSRPLLQGRFPRAVMAIDARLRET